MYQSVSACRGVMGFFDEKASGAYRYKLLRNDRLIYVLKQVGKSMFSAMIWPAFGTAISVFVKNRKVALAFPFLLLRFWRFIIPDEAYFLETSNLELNGSVIKLPLGGYIYAVTYCLCVAFLCVVIVYTGLRILLRKNG